jgi:hypothetical protein
MRSRRGAALGPAAWCWPPLGLALFAVALVAALWLAPRFDPLPASWDPVVLGPVVYVPVTLLLAVSHPFWRAALAGVVLGAVHAGLVFGAEALGRTVGVPPEAPGWNATAVAALSLVWAPLLLAPFRRLLNAPPRRRRGRDRDDRREGARRSAPAWTVDASAHAIVVADPVRVAPAPVASAPVVTEPPVAPPAVVAPAADSAPPAPAGSPAARSEPRPPAAEPLDEVVRVSFARVQDQFPAGMFLIPPDRIPANLLEPGYLLVPQRLVIPQLADGVVRLEWYVVAEQFPRQALALSDAEVAARLPGGALTLPLDEVVPQLPPEVFADLAPALDTRGLDDVPPLFVPDPPPPGPPDRPATPPSGAPAPPRAAVAPPGSPEPPAVAPAPPPGESALAGLEIEGAPDVTALEWEPLDAEPLDGEPSDTGARDEGALDVGPPGAGALDAEALEAGTPDAGPLGVEPVGAASQEEMPRPASPARARPRLAPTVVPAVLAGLRRALGARDLDACVIEDGTLGLVIAGGASAAAATAATARVRPVLARSGLGVEQLTVRAPRVTLVFHRLGGHADGAHLVAAFPPPAPVALLERLVLDAMRGETEGGEEPPSLPAGPDGLEEAPAPADLHALAATLRGCGPVVPRLFQDPVSERLVLLFCPAEADPRPLARALTRLHHAAEAADLGPTSLSLRLGSWRAHTRAMVAEPAGPTLVVAVAGPSARPALAGLEVDQALARLMSGER